MLKTILIDDEMACLDVLSSDLHSYCPEVQILAICNQPEKGLEAIQNLEPDLVFLDIEMPNITGIDLMKRLKQPSFSVIFTTAYDKYAVQAFRLSALDYLLKPIVKDELMNAVQKARHFLNKQHLSERVEILAKQISEQQDQRICFPSTYGYAFYTVSDILYCCAGGNYTDIYLKAQKKPLTVTMQLKKVEEKLKTYQFQRIHQSHLVNLKYLVEFDRRDNGFVTMLDGKRLPVSRSRKEELLGWIQRR